MWNRAFAISTFPSAADRGLLICRESRRVIVVASSITGVGGLITPS